MFSQHPDKKLRLNMTSNLLELSPHFNPIWPSWFRKKTTFSMIPTSQHCRIRQCSSTYLVLVSNLLHSPLIVVCTYTTKKEVSRYRTTRAVVIILLFWQITPKKSYYYYLSYWAVYLPSKLHFIESLEILCYIDICSNALCPPHYIDISRKVTIAFQLEKYLIWHF